MTIAQTEHLCKVLEDESWEAGSKRSMRLLAAAGAKTVIPRGKGCLYVEVELVTPIVHFMVFERVGKNKPTHIMKSEVKGLPSEIVGLVQSQVRRFAEERLEAEERFLAIDVYEV